MPIATDPGNFGNLYVKVSVDYNFSFSQTQLELMKEIFGEASGIDTDL